MKTLFSYAIGILLCFFIGFLFYLFVIVLFSLPEGNITGDSIVLILSLFVIVNMWGSVLFVQRHISNKNMQLSKQKMEELLLNVSAQNERKKTLE